ncbi:MAG: hypothetical protein NVS1B4_22550 [Gemmatimonadaceae bacterium]
MRRSVAITVAIACLVAQRPESVGAQDTGSTVSAQAIVGAWRIVSRTYISSDSTYTERQRDPGYYLFVAGTYAFVAPGGPSPRPTDQSTDAHRIALYNTLGAQAGPYALHGDTLTLHALAAKNQGNVGMKINWRASVHGDTLLLQSHGTYKRMTRDHARYVLVRARDDGISVQTGAASGVTSVRGSATTLPRGDSVQREVRATLRELDEALRRNDADAIARIYADDFVHVGSDGRTATKAERIAEVRAGARRYLSVEAREDPRVRIMGETAIATVRAMTRWIEHGEPHASDAVVTRVLARRENRWELIFTQVTAVRPTAPVAAGSDDAKVVAEVGRLRKLLPAAWIRGDIAMLDTLIADDYVSISGQGFVSKRQSFAPIASGARRIVSLNYDSVKVRTFGDVAVETGWVQGNAVSGGVTQIGKGGRYTLIFAQRNGRWQLVSHQYSANQPVVAPASDSGRAAAFAP